MLGSPATTHGNRSYPDRGRIAESRQPAVLTITDLLQTELPDGTAVLAGADYLGREVSWATALRARAPGLGSLRGREIVLLSRGVLRALDTSLTLARAVEQLQPL